MEYCFCRVFIREETKMEKLDVRSFGAVGDGVTLDTAAIQAAIDACSDHKATLVFTPGTYYTGTLLLKSGLHIYLEEGAMLLGSTSMDDYFAYSPFVDAVGVTRGKAMIMAYDAEDVIVEGKGTINGNGKNVVYEMDRPFLFKLEKSRKITIRGIHLEGSVCWCLHIDRCKDVIVENASIYNRGLENNDGIDIDASENVFIDGCDINCGDDAICLKATSMNPCRNIHAKNCRISTNWGAFKIGTESAGDFSNIIMEDSYFYDVMGGGIKIVPVDGGFVRDVIVRNIKMVNCTGPIFIANGRRNRVYLGEQNPNISGMDNILIENIQADVIKAPLHGFYFGEDWGEALGGILISGIPERKIGGITLRNLQLDLPGGFMEEKDAYNVREMADMYPEFHRFDPVPAKGLYIRHAENIKVENVQLTYKKDDVRAEMYMEDADAVEVRR